MKRYNLVIPTEVHNQLQGVAEDKHTTIVAIIRQCITLGLLANELSKKPGSALIIREDGREREIILL